MHAYISRRKKKLSQHTYGMGIVDERRIRDEALLVGRELDLGDAKRRGAVHLDGLGYLVIERTLQHSTVEFAKRLLVYKVKC
jgi:hypothetical protein